jgi:isoquinoline 1-oxidoreductase beta subunit
MTGSLDLSRRDFVRAGLATGAGLTLAIYLPGCRPGVPPTQAPLAPDGWLRILADGSVIVVVDRSEMGQGVLTALPMLVAEELDADWARVRFETAPAHAAYTNRLLSSPEGSGGAGEVPAQVASGRFPDPPPMAGMQGTGGSTSVRNAWISLRRTGARARAMLLQAAAARWGVAIDGLRTESGVVLDPASGRRLGYGELAVEAGKLPLPKEVRLKDRKDFRLIGRPVPRLDLPDLVRGAGGFSVDVKLPGMLHAVVARAPVFGASIKSFDPGPALAIPGVRHVVRLRDDVVVSTGTSWRMPGGIAVVADSWWQAREGRAALKVTWEEGPLAHLDSRQITETFKRLAEAPAAAVPRNDGDAAGALRSAARTIEAVYELPFLAHATMEPMNCVADVKPDSCTIWAPTQFQWAGAAGGGGAQGLAARLAGVPQDRVSVHTSRLGGGFGRRSEMDFISDAVQVSRAVGAPVKVMWSREDDLQHDYYRPASYNVLRAGLDGANDPVAWTHRIVCPSILARLYPGFIPDWLRTRLHMLQNGADPTSVEGSVNLPYAIPNLRVEYTRADVGVPVGFWRSVGNSHTSFVVESFIDELAHAAGKDPFEFRRTLLARAPRHRAVLELAAGQAGWGTAPPPGRGRGIALQESFGSFVAQVAEVSVEGGTVRVHRVVCAVDCGIVVNPDIVEAQIEGGVVFGLTAALHGEITLKDGRVAQSNFHDYPMLRINEMPLVEVHIKPSSEPPGGVGEVGTPPIAPAVANAIFAATGTRVRRLPIRL